MYVRGKGVEFSTVRAIVEKVSAEYGGNVIVHPDAGPIGKITRTVHQDGSGYVSTANGYGFRGRIIAVSSKGEGARRSASGRRGPWACWHAYGRVMREVMRTYPHAVITSAFARYEGEANFLTKYPRTADYNIGSRAFPVCAADVCDCDSDDLD